MASNFKIEIHRSRANLHLKLMGDFDGTSAWELSNLITQNCCGPSTVIIHTDDLHKIYPFGAEVFRDHLLGLRNDAIWVKFTGEYAPALAPEDRKAYLNS